MINQIAKEAHQTMIENGFYDDVRDDYKDVALIASEAHELMEEIRRNTHHDRSDKIDDDREAEELADIVLRVFDYAIAHGVDIGRAILLKHEYNTKRPYRHGKQF